MKHKLGNLIGLLSITSFAGYSFMFALTRDQFPFMLLVYTVLFACFIGMLYAAKYATKNKLHILPTAWGSLFYGYPLLGGLFITGLVLRLSLIEYTPNLSQDFYRFIWDGHMVLNGFNPYTYLPDNLIASGAASHVPNASFLHANMGEISGKNYSNYPPLNQLFFAIASFLGGKSMLATVVWMRVIIIAFDIGIFIIGLKLLKLLGKPLWLICLYYLNPFVIVELTGNLHWEGAMAFFSLLGVYFLFKSQRLKSAVFLGYGVLVKLIPLLMLPVLFRRLTFKKSIVYYLVVLGVIVLGFLPFINDTLLSNYSKSVGLWFGNFEYNAGVFNLIKAAGYEFTGSNVIKVAGKILPLLSVTIIVVISLFRKNENPETLLATLVYAFTAYLFLTTTVHPWYLVMPLLFTVFTNTRYMLLWSYTVFLSYQGYSNPGNFEHGWILALEYVPVYGLLIYELFCAYKIKVNLAQA